MGNEMWFQAVQDYHGEICVGGHFEEVDRYIDFLKRKAVVHQPVGITASDLHPSMFTWQADIVRWTLRKGRCALFAGTGMGKTIMQLEWARQAAKRVLVLAPLAVSVQTVEEGSKFGITVTRCESEAEAPETGIVTTNYERMDKFDASKYGAVVLDESSILKDFTGRIRGKLIEAFRDVPMRLCCTATPAPNDIEEMGNHAEFLGIMTRVEMLASFFVHDDTGWRLKKHATEPFYKWLASWAMTISKPSDLGYEDDGFKLPELSVKPQFVTCEIAPADGSLFPSARGITGRTTVRRASMASRIKRAVEIVNREPDEQWLIWCGLNEESTVLADALGACEVKGQDSEKYKIESLSGFAHGDIKRLVSKTKICGHGLNFQSCARMLFVGLGDSWEQYYQALKRCHRYGQKRSVDAYVVLSEHESVVWNNVMAKQQEADTMQKELLKHVTVYETEELKGHELGSEYFTSKESGDGWELWRGDSCELLREVKDHSIGLAVFSPPFESLYTYSNSERDLGNSRKREDFWEQFGFIGKELKRVLMPGRNVAVHCTQLALLKQTDGVIGMRDFRGELIRHFTEWGFVYHGEVCIDTDPQAQAIRTHTKGLAFVQLRKDAAWMRPAYADYILIFRSPGENEVPVGPDVTNDEWIEWARPVWYNVDKTNTLNIVEGRDNRDERHICPLSLDIIERCVRLWSNKGETVLSPFAGIGSEGYVSILHGRKFQGIELKASYFNCAVKNLKDAQRKASAGTLFAKVSAE